MMTKSQKFNMKILNMKEWIKLVFFVKKGLRLHEEATKFKTIS